MPEIISNPVAHLHKLDPPVSPKKRAMKKEQAKIQKRIAKFEAQRAQEDAMAGVPSGMVMQDMPDSRPAQRRLERKPIPQSAGQSVHTIAPNRAAVQHVQRTPPPAHEVVPAGDAIMKELEAEFAAPPSATEPESTAPAPEIADEDVETIMKRFKGTPDEIAKQIAKSYSNSEKRLRKLEQENRLLMNPNTVAQPQQTAQPLQPMVTQQVQTAPTFNYKRVKDEILDKGDEIFKEFEGHVDQKLDQKLAQLVGPLYTEALDNRLFRKYGDVVTEENLDVIKAMAQREPGNDPWEKMQSAVAKYKQAMPNLTPKPNADVQQMETAAQTPAPKARATSEKKMWKASDLRKVMQRPDYRYDLNLRSIVDRAYAEGRVLRDQ